MTDISLVGRKMIIILLGGRMIITILGKTPVGLPKTDIPVTA